MSAEPSDPPQQVTLGDVTSTSIKVTWAPVKFEDQNGIIKGYKVIYRALPNGQNVTKVVDTENALTIGGLNEFTNYSIRVLAFTAVGDGPLSVTQVKQTLEDSKFFFGIYAIGVTLKYTVGACTHIIWMVSLFYLKALNFVYNHLPLSHYYIDNRFCVVIVFTFSVLRVVFFIIFNFMKDKIVSESSRFVFCQVCLRM